MEDQNNQNPTSPVFQDTQTPSPTPPASSAVAETTKSKFPILIIGIILFLLIAGSAAGFYVLKQQNSKTAVKPTPTPIVQTPTPTPDPTTNWKTYVDTDYSVRYPSNLMVEKSTNPKPYDDLVTFRYPYPSYGHEFLDGIQIITKPNPGNLTLKVWLSQQAHDNSKDKEFSIGNVIGINTSFPSAGQGSNDYLFEHNGKIYDVDLLGDFMNNDTLLEQFLSTFKFTNSNITPTPDPTANWKAYQGSGFTFKYPAEWNLKSTNNKITLTLQSPNKPSGNDQLTQNTITIETDNNPNNQLLDKWIEQKYGNGFNKSDVKYKNVNGNDIAQTIYPSMYGGTLSVFLHDKIVVTVFTEGSGTNLTETEVIKDQILSTFKLTN